MREDVLPRMRPPGALPRLGRPLEIIVVDASPGWESTGEHILREILGTVARHPMALRGGGMALELL
jgi:hypothetical protein